MSFREPASLDDSSPLGRIAARLVERFVLPFTDSLATGALAVLAVPVGCASIAIAMLGAGILTFFLPPELSVRVLAGGFIVGVVAAALLLLNARGRFKAAVRRTAEGRIIRPVRNLGRDPRFLTLQERVRDRVRARIEARRAAIPGAWRRARPKRIVPWRVRDDGRAPESTADTGETKTVASTPTLAALDRRFAASADDEPGETGEGGPRLT